MTTIKPRSVKLVPLTSLQVEQQMKLRDVRNEEGVRRWMYTDHVIEASEHLAWVAKLKSDGSQIIFAVIDESGDVVGAAGLNAVDRLHRKADWSHYLTAAARGGLGSAIRYAFVDFAFGPFGLEKLNSEVIAGNDAVVKLHKKFLFEEEGFRKSNIDKEGVRTGVHLLGLIKNEWTAGRSAVWQRYSKVLEQFAVSVQWAGEATGAGSPIDQIEAARARNNLNWMGILRLALEKSPDAAKPIVSDIRTLDREIAELTRKLLG